MTVVGLIDDGMFEQQIQTSAALLGEMLWNPNRSEKAVLRSRSEPLLSNCRVEGGIG